MMDQKGLKMYEKGQTSRVFGPKIPAFQQNCGVSPDSGKSFQAE